MSHSNWVFDVPNDCLIKIMGFLGDPISVVNLTMCCKTLHRNLYPEFLLMPFKVLPWFTIKQLVDGFVYSNRSWRISTRGFVFDTYSITDIINVISANIHKNRYSGRMINRAKYYVTYGICLPFICLDLEEDSEDLELLIDTRQMTEYYTCDESRKIYLSQFEYVRARFHKFQKYVEYTEPSNFISPTMSIPENSLILFTLADFMYAHIRVFVEKTNQLFPRVVNLLDGTECTTQLYQYHMGFHVRFSNDVVLSVITEDLRRDSRGDMVYSWCLYLNGREINTGMTQSVEFILSFISRVYRIASSRTAKRLTNANLPKQVRRDLRKRLRNHLRDTSS